MLVLLAGGMVEGSGHPVGAGPAEEAEELGPAEEAEPVRTGFDADPDVLPPPR